MADTAPSSFSASCAGLLTAIVIAVAIAVVAMVPQQASLVAAIAVTEGSVLLGWLLAGFGIGDLLLRRVAVHASLDAALAVVTRVAIGLGAMSVLTLLLGMLGLLTRLSASAMLLAGLALAVGRIYTNRNTITESSKRPAGAAWLLSLTVPTLAVMLIGAFVLPGLLWGLDDPAGYDVVAYHLQMPREWYELGRVTPLRHNVFSFFPLNVEMHYLLAMHLRGGAYSGMYLAQLMHGSLVALTLAAVYGAARSRSRLAAGVAAVVCAGVPWMLMLGSVAYNEGGLMLYSTLAAAWAMRGRWAIAGACAGLAAGSKLTGVASAVLLVPLVVGPASFLWSAAVPAASAVPEVPPQRHGVTLSIKSVAVRGLVAFAILALLAFSPWLTRTTIASGGNPVFPLAARTLGAGNFDAGQVERFEIAHGPREDQRSVSGRLTALWQQVGGDYHYGSIALGNITLPLWLLLIVPAIVLARRDREAWIWLGLILGNVVIWLAATHLQGRFLVQVIPCVALLVACAVGRVASGSPAELTAPDRRGRAFAGVAVIVAIVSFAAAMRAPLSTLVGSNGAANAIGVQDAESLRPLLRDEVGRAVYESGRPIVLLGDAKAFWYAIPSARLRYRSVFDVASTKSFRDAWLGDGVPNDALVIVDPAELGRFARTYRNLPALPEAWRDRREPFVVRAADVPR